MVTFTYPYAHEDPGDQLRLGYWLEDDGGHQDFSSWVGFHCVGPAFTRQRPMPTTARLASPVNWAQGSMWLRDHSQDIMAQGWSGGELRVLLPHEPLLSTSFLRAQEGKRQQAASPPVRLTGAGNWKGAQVCSFGSSKPGSGLCGKMLFKSLMGPDSGGARL